VFCSFVSAIVVQDSVVTVCAAVECTFIVLCRQSYEESKHDEVGKDCMQSNCYMSKHLIHV